MHELEVGFRLVVVRVRDGGGRPKEREIVGEHGEEDAEEEEGC